MRRRRPAAAPAAPAAPAACAAPASRDAAAAAGRTRASAGLRPAVVATAIVAPLAAELASVLAATGARRVVRVRVQAPARRGGWRIWLRRPRRPRRPRWSRRTVILGRLAGEEVALMATGDGPAAAAAGLEALLAAVRPRRLLAIGVAGGLTAGLAEGTLVAARRVVAGDGGTVPREPDAAWLAAALAGGAIAGAIVSADRILADPAARQALLFEALPAATAAAMPATMPAIATVDLESAAYARVAAAWSLPYLVVRAVLDPASEELPLDFEACRDASGRVSNARVVWHALARPRSLAKLWRLRARVRDAATRLAAFAERLVTAPADGVPARQGGHGARTAAGTGNAGHTREASDSGEAAAVDMRREIPAAAAGRRTA